MPEDQRGRMPDRKEREEILGHGLAGEALLVVGDHFARTDVMKD